MKKRVVSVLFLTCIFVSACATAPVQHPETGLQDSVGQFMQAQVDGDWEKAYSYYDDSTRKRIPKEKYVTQPRKLFYKNYRIENIDLKGDDRAEVFVKIDISFQGHDFKDAPQKQEWIRKGDKWVLRVEQMKP